MHRPNSNRHRTKNKIINTTANIKRDTECKQNIRKYAS